MPDGAMIEKGDERHLTGEIARVKVRPTDSGFVSLVVRSDDGSLHTIAGSMPFAKTRDVRPGTRVEAVGRFARHEKYGMQFKASSIMRAVPHDAGTIYAWLQSSNIEGVGNVTVDSLRRHFGDRIVRILEDRDVDAMVSVGCSRTRAERIVAAWDREADNPRIKTYSWLCSIGVGPKTAEKIINIYGLNARRQIEEDPWAIAEVVKGIGFAKADEIGRAAGAPMDSPSRIRAAVHQALTVAADDGHTGVNLAEIGRYSSVPLQRLKAAQRRLFRYSVMEILTVRAEDGRILYRPPISCVTPIVRSMIEQRELSFSKALSDDPERQNFLQSPEIRNAEETIARKVAQALSEGTGFFRRDDPDLDRRIREAMRRRGLRENEAQISAMKTALCSPLAVLTGGPGTGKSTICRIVFDCLPEGAAVMGGGPTGMAAENLRALSGREAMTNHRVLAWTPLPFDGSPPPCPPEAIVNRGFFAFNADNPLDVDYLVLDELTMADTRMSAHLFRAVDFSRTRVLLVGDIHQIKSVEPGSVFADIIGSGVVPTEYLELNQRFQGNAAEGEVNPFHKAADDIRRGIVPKVVSDGSTPYTTIHRASAQEIADEIVDLVTNRLPNGEYGEAIDPLRDVQVIVPQYAGACGIDEINRRIKEALNPVDENDRGSYVRTGRRIISIGDRVLNLANKERLDLQNGSVGVVVGIDHHDPEGLRVDVDFRGRIVGLERDDLNDLVLAYAISAHKTQGSQYPVTVCGVSTSHWIMLERSLFYTPVTRTQQRCFVVGEPRAIARAVQNNADSRRRTLLRERIVRAMGQSLAIIRDPEAPAMAPAPQPDDAPVMALG